MAEVWILTEHPDVKGPPVTRTLNSFLNLYEKKGWVAVETPTKKPESNREAFARVFGDVERKDAVKGPKGKSKQKPADKEKSDSEE